MPAGRPPYSNASSIVWEIVTHPRGDGYALYCRTLNQYAMDIHANVIKWFPDITAAKRYKSSNVFRGI
jgi:hypothetical protein